MPTLANGVARVEMVMRQDGQIVENVWYCGGADDTIITLNTIGDLMMVQWRQFVMPHVSELVDLLFTRTTYLGVANGNTVESPAPPDSNGQETSPALPNHVTACVKLVTGLGGRSRRGRKYHIGLCESQVTMNNLVPAFKSTLENAYQEWVYDAIAGPHPIVICSFIVNGVPRPFAQVTPVINALLDPVIDSMRRRLPGRGT